MPFTYLINAASLSTAVNALSFKYEILAKLCLKPENGTLPRVLHCTEYPASRLHSF